LISGGRAYFENAIAATAPGPAAMERVTKAFETAQRQAAMAGERVSRGATAADYEALAGIWSNMWQAIDASLDAASRERIRHLPIR
jgi:hypothetical protein